MKDLEEQGGLAGVIISPFSVSECGCSGETLAGTNFIITWVRNVFLLISVSQEEEALIDAFSKVVEYRPFCRYICKKSGFLTFEWDKKDPDRRFDQLEKDGQIKLKRIT